MIQNFDNICSVFGIKDDVPRFTEGAVIHNVAKVYPDMIKVYVYKEPMILRPHRINSGKRKKKENYVPDERSIRRSKRTLTDYILCNDFELFCTFTFDSKVIDRQNVQACKLRMENWLRSQRLRHSPGLQYIVVPEFHKDGQSLHFHALLANFNGRLKDSKHKHGGRPVFNLTGWRSGFSTAVRIDNREAVAHYVTKYITKDMAIMFGKKRYFSSRNLRAPEKIQNAELVELTLPLFNRHVYDAGRYDVYRIDTRIPQKVLDNIKRSAYNH